MATTYCGKNCAQCEKKEQLHCPGCKHGPGRQFVGDCDIAKCVHRRGEEACMTCVLRQECRTRKQLNDMPNILRKRAAQEENNKMDTSRRILVLNRWLGVLFWATLFYLIFGAVSGESIRSLSYELFFYGNILRAIAGGISGVVLLKLASEDDGYRTAGICQLITCGGALLMSLLTGTDDQILWTVLLTIVVAIATLVGKNSMYISHSAVLSGIDAHLATKWELLWKWFLVMYLISVCGGIGIIISALLGALGVLLMTIGVIASAIGVFVVYIIELVYVNEMRLTINQYLEYN